MYWFWNVLLLCPFLLLCCRLAFNQSIYEQNREAFSVWFKYYYPLPPTYALMMMMNWIVIVIIEWNTINDSDLFMSYADSYSYCCKNQDRDIILLIYLIHNTIRIDSYIQAMISLPFPSKVCKTKRMLQCLTWLEYVMIKFIAWKKITCTLLKWVIIQILYINYFEEL